MTTPTPLHSLSEARAEHFESPLNIGPPVYDAPVIERILSWHTFWKAPDLWKEAAHRFLEILVFFVQIIWMTWWDRQIWSYIGEEDIDKAQMLRRHRHGQRITEKLLALGPTFIKVGQSLSTRVDLLRKEYIEELSQLQDRVPPFSLKEVYATIQQELGESPHELFATFDPTPLAAASLGQVHRVTLHSGEEAVIKVQRPNLVHRFEVDLSILKRVARFLQRHTEVGRHREWVNIVDEFGRTLFEEVDYIQEGRNADRFRRNLANLEATIVIPKIYWRYTSRRVITMAYCPGVKINDILKLESLGLSCEETSVKLVQAYFQQLLLDGFFHADPHPGNIVIREDGKIILYDFGMVGSIQEDTRIKMVNTFLNIVGKRTDAILKNLVELNMVTQTADLEEIRTVVDWALDNYYDVPHDQLNFEQLADEMAEVMYYYPFKLPATFTFMFRALITLEGVATQLYPQVRFMAVAVDYAKAFLQEKYLFDKLFSANADQNYLGLLKEGLDLIGFSGFKDRSATSAQRVRLYHDEWKPLARYVKAGFLVLAFGQTICVVSLITFMLLLMQRYSPQDMFYGVFGMLTLLMFYLIITFGTIIWLPARKKPVLFNPPKTKKISQNAQEPFGR